MSRNTCSLKQAVRGARTGEVAYMEEKILDFTRTRDLREPSDRPLLFSAATRF